MAKTSGGFQKYIVFTAKYDGKTAEVQAKKGFQKIGESAKKAATTTQGMVGDKMGRAMSQFNEKTEKGRQLMTAFGGSLGAAGGQVTYYAGTLSYVIGRFSRFELGIMAAIGAAVILGKALHDLIWGPLDEFIEKTDQMIESFKTSQKELGKLIDDVKWKLTGLAKMEIDIIKQRSELHKIDQRRVAIEKEMRILEEDLSGADALKRHAKLGKQLKETNKAYTDQVDLMRQLKDAQGLALPPLAPIVKDAPKTTKLSGAAARQVGMAGMLMGLLLPEQIAQVIAFNAQAIEAEAEYQSIRLMKEVSAAADRDKDARLNAQISWEQKRIRVMLDLKKKEADEMARIEEERQRKELQSRDEVVRNSLALFEEMGALIVQGEEGRKAVRIAAIVATAAYEAAMEVAQGWKELGFGNPVTAAAHFTAAALFAAVAAGQVATEAGGGGAGTTSEREHRQGRGESPWGEGKRESTIIIQIGRNNTELGRVLHEELEGFHDSRNPNRAHNRVGY
jgi:hypothetical protein